MNWFKQNKGLSAYFLLVLAGSGFLGFKLVDAQSRLEESMDAFGGSAQELNRLRALAPYPEKQNLERVQAQQSELSAEVDQLRAGLRANQLPLEPVTEVEFQDRLKETVERITASAAKAGVALPEKFYMGFDQYQSEPPKKELAPHLARQLKAIEWVISQMIANRVRAVERLSREPLPEEAEKQKGVKAAKVEKAEPDRTQGRSGRLEAASQPEDESKREIVRHGFEVGFRSAQASFQKTLNEVAASKVQFYIPTRLEVRNEKEKGPAKDEVKPAEGEAGGAEAAPNPSAPPTAAAAKSAATKEAGELRYIVGEELVVVDLRLDVVHFSEPEEGREKKKKSGGGSK
ncbi:MAG: hypothetical protein RLZZ253_1570 [Verrucomicrobiota bacterium]